MTLPRIGESLDKTQTLAAKARTVTRDGYDETCAHCKTSPYPRGYSMSSLRCWYCEFPR